MHTLNTALPSIQNTKLTPASKLASHYWTLPSRLVGVAVRGDVGPGAGAVPGGSASAVEVSADAPGVQLEQRPLPARHVPACSIRCEATECNLTGCC